MSEKILGLELSLDSLTAVVIRKSFNKYNILDSTTIPFSFKTSDQQESIKDNFDNAVKTLLSTIDVKGCSSSALCLPAHFISFRTLNVPFSSESKIRQILPYELTAHLPMNQNSYISDFIQYTNLNTTSDLTQRPADNNAKTEFNRPSGKYIFTASLPINIMDICFYTLKQYGLEPELVTSNGLLASAYINNNIALDNTNNVIDVLIEKTKSGSVISFLLKKSIIAVRTFVGEKDIDFIEKTIIQTVSGLSQKYDIEILNINKFNLLDLIDIKAFSNHTILCSMLNIETIKPQITILDSVRLFNAAAAALSCFKRKKVINFCQNQYAKNSFFNKFKDRVIILSFFAAISFFSFFINIEIDILNLKKEVESIDSAITDIFKKNFPDADNVVEPLMQMQVKIRELEQSGFILGGLDGSPNNIRMVDILYELSNKIPANIDIEVTRFLLSNGKVVIAGNTDNFNTIDRVKTLLETSDKFKTVTINSATADRTGKKVLFNFIIDLKR